MMKALQLSHTLSTIYKGCLKYTILRINEVRLSFNCLIAFTFTIFQVRVPIKGIGTRQGSLLWVTDEGLFQTLFC